MAIRCGFYGVEIPKGTYVACVMIFFFFFCYVSFAPEEAIYASSSEQRDYVKKKEC